MRRREVNESEVVRGRVRVRDEGRREHDQVVL